MKRIKILMNKVKQNNLENILSEKQKKNIVFICDITLMILIALTFISLYIILN